jgi:hypothetical protein
MTSWSPSIRQTPMACRLPVALSKTATDPSEKNMLIGAVAQASGVSADAHAPGALAASKATPLEAESAANIAERTTLFSSLCRC